MEAEGKRRGWKKRSDEEERGAGRVRSNLFLGFFLLQAVNFGPHTMEYGGINVRSYTFQIWKLSLSAYGPTFYFWKKLIRTGGHRVRLQGARALCSLTLYQGPD
jgi:hypothetical protein